MGIYSRDYVRESSGRRGGWMEDTPACKRLIILTFVAFFVELLAPHQIRNWFALDLDGALSGRVWQLVTCAFLHSIDDPWHIIFNMLGLWWFGPEMERIYGSKEFTFFYLAAAIASSLGFIGWQLAAGETRPMLGASGAVLAVMTLYATHFPHEKIGIFFGLVMLEIRWVVAIFAFVDLLPVLRSLQGQRDLSGVAHAAHLLGILFGWAYRHYDWRLSNWFDLTFIASLPRRWRQSRSRKSFRVFDPEPTSATDIDTEVDRILAKIHEQGTDSLTEREQAILTRASQQYKNRK